MQKLKKYYPDCSIFGMENDDQFIFNGILNKLLNPQNQAEGVKKQKILNNKKFLNNINEQKIEVTFGTEPLRQGAFGIVASGTYENKPVIVKRRKPFKGTTIDLTSFLIEAIIQGILYKLTKGECPVKVPQLYKFAKCEFPMYETRNGVRTQRFETDYVLVMEEVKGEVLNKFDKLPLRIHLATVIEGLEFLQDLKFVHRDFHSGNIIIRNKTPYIIDFGKACVGGITSIAAIQDYEETFYTKCTNRSHDVCCLLLDLAIRKVNEYHLQRLAKEICDTYKTKVTESPRPDFDTQYRFSDHHWANDIFHWFYLTSLEEIDLAKYVPKFFLENHLEFFGLKCNDSIQILRF